MKLQMLKQALIAYVASSLKAIWSAVAHPLSIVGKKNCGVADYRIYGNSVQNGEPTPDNPVEVQSVGDYDDSTGKYKVPIMISTENLIDVSKASSTTTRYGERGIKQTRAADTNGGGRFPVNIKAGTTIYFSFKFVGAGGSNTNKNIYLRAYPTDGGDRFAIFQLYYLKEGKRYINSYTATKDIKQVEFYTMSVWEVGSYFILDDVKLTTTEQKTANIYLDEPLRADRVCRDEIDFGRGIVIRRVAKITFDGSEKWEKYSSYEHTFKYDYGFRTASIADGYGKCSHYKVTGTSKMDTDGYCVTGNSYSGFFTDYRFSTVDEFKTFLAEQAQAGNPVTLVNGVYEWYNNGKPKEEPIELPNLPQFKGTTVYEAQTEIPPSGIEVQYF